MMPVTLRPCSSSSSSSDHSYELPLRRNLFLLDFLDLLRFIAGVLLDRLGVAPCHIDVVLPGQAWGEELVDAAAAERILETALRAHSTSEISSYRRRQASLPLVEDGGAGSSAEEYDEGVCAICLCGLETGGGCHVAELCSCSHAFHAACIDAWVSSGEAATCPLCRVPVSPAASDGPVQGVGACHARAPC